MTIRTRGVKTSGLPARLLIRAARTMALLLALGSSAAFDARAEENDLDADAPADEAGHEAQVRVDDAKPKRRPPRLPRPELTPDSAAKLSQDPLSNIFSLLIQDDLSFFKKTDGDVSNALVLKPIIPFPVRRWLVVTRWTLPISRIPDVTTTKGSARGLGDIDMTTWFVPPQTGAWEFGFGVGKGFATATTEELSTLGWSVGPAAIAIYRKGPWIAGMAASYEYSISTGSQIYSMQNGLAYNMGSGWALVTQPNVTGIWRNDQLNGWVVPVGGGIAKTWVVKRLAIGLGVQGYYNIVRPDYVGRFTLRTELRLFLQGFQPRDWLAKVPMPKVPMPPLRLP